MMNLRNRDINANKTRDTVFILCPVCKSKTRIKLRPDTVLENFPLFCPKCRQETLISVKDMKVSAIRKGGHNE